MQKRKYTKREPQTEVPATVDPNPIVPQSMKVEIVPDSAKEEEGENKRGGEEVIAPVDINTTTPELTCDEIRGMTVIQIHALVKNQYPQFVDLLDIYNRDRLQNQLMFKLGL